MSTQEIISELRTKSQTVKSLFDKYADHTALLFVLDNAVWFATNYLGYKSLEQIEAYILGSVSV